MVERREIAQKRDNLLYLVATKSIAETVLLRTEIAAFTVNRCTYSKSEGGNATAQRKKKTRKWDVDFDPSWTV